MLNQYFGAFLLNKGYIDGEVLKSLLSQEKQGRIKIGTLAVSSGLLTARQVEEIHSIQRVQDKRFGEIAQDLGYLVEGQIEGLLQQQKSSQIELGQLLVDEGIMDLAGLEQAINEYKAEAKLSENQFNAIKSGNIEKLVETFINIPSSAGQRELTDYVGLFLRNVIRFIDTMPVFDVLDDIKLSNELVAQQVMLGDLNLETNIIMPEDMFVKFAARYAQMDIKERNELADASVTEYLNLHNGLFVVNMSEHQQKVELHPPRVLNASELQVTAASIICSVKTDLGEIGLLLNVK